MRTSRKILHNRSCHLDSNTKLTCEKLGRVFWSLYPCLLAVEPNRPLLKFLASSLQLTNLRLVAVFFFELSGANSDTEVLLCLGSLGEEALPLAYLELKLVVG